MSRLAAALALVVLVSTGCSRATKLDPAAIDDARLGVRVKTALVNDAALGTRIVEVRVDRGVVTLSGLVGSTSEADRAIELARAIPGVVDVRSQLVVAQGSELRAPVADDAPVPRSSPVPRQRQSASLNRRLAIGAAIGTQRPTNDRLDTNANITPMVRLGVGRGLGLGMGFSWFQTDISSPDTSQTLGRITVRPVMAGVNYTLNDQTRWALSLSLVAGLAFNGFTFEESTARDGIALDVDNSFAMRPGASLWYDINSRAALNVFAGYLITRPGMTFLERGQFVRRSVRADATLLTVGLAWKLF
jgi:hyperosmotically inducible protein